MLKTEQRNPRTTHIDTMNTLEMVQIINDENLRVIRAVEAADTEIAAAADAAAAAICAGGRLFYIGAGTSGRLGVLDASECPPTFGVSETTVTGIMAGGDRCLRSPSEGAEDNEAAGAADFLACSPSPGDVLVGISASGGAAYVLGAIQAAKKRQCITVGLTCNRGSPLSECADIPIITDTGAEVITGSTRMKAGTAHKIVLNTISTCAMIKAGYVCENLMINLQPSNQKLRARMVRIVAELAGVDEPAAEALLDQAGWDIRSALHLHRERM